MIGSNQALYAVTNKTTYCQDDFLICSYELSFVCCEEFFLQFNIEERDASSQMKYMINATQTAMMQYDDQETQKRIKHQVTKFDSKRGLFWYVNVTILTCADGSFCIFDKNSANINTISIMPDRQTCEKLKTILKNYSLTESKTDCHAFWLFLRRVGPQIMIGNTYVCFEAYSSPHSSNPIANSKLIMLADVSCSVQSKKNISNTR
jgi:hypothetical protein